MQSECESNRWPIRPEFRNLSAIALLVAVTAVVTPMAHADDATPSFVPSGSCDTCPGDLDGDGFFTPNDFNLMFDCLGSSVAPPCQCADIGSIDPFTLQPIPVPDGQITTADLTLLNSMIPGACPAGITDCNTNGISDALDIAAGTSLDCQPDGTPDECQINTGTATDCDGNGIPDDCDLLGTGGAADYNTNGLPDACDIFYGTADDCDFNGAIDAGDIAFGQASDCNHNNIPDICDILGGFSLDTDLNGIPDECQTDCNTNGSPDPDDIFTGLATDLDGDLVPDFCDSDPFIYNRDQQSAGSHGVIDIELVQLDLVPTNAALPLLNSDYGRLRVTLPHLGTQLVYINAEVNGVHAIVNMPAVARDHVVLSPRETHATTFPIGPAGIDRSGTIANVRIMATTAPQPAISPTATLYSLVIGSAVESQGGAFGPQFLVNQQVLPAPALGNGQFGPTSPVTIFPRRVTRPGFNMVDLNSPSEGLACIPGAVGSSFVWLNRTYCLGQPEGATPEATKNSVLETFKSLMHYNPVRTGVLWIKVFPAVRSYIRNNRLPITVEGQGAGSPNPGDAIQPCDIMKELEKGQDVEVHYVINSIGHDAMGNQIVVRRYGHTRSIVGMTKDGNDITVTTHDDGDQTTADANPMADNRPSRNIMTGKLVRLNGNWVVCGAGEKAVIAGWIAESPTRAAINRALCVKTASIEMPLAVANTVDELCKLEADAAQLKYLAERMRNHLRMAMPRPNQAQRQHSQRMINHACFLKYSIAEAKRRAMAGDAFENQRDDAAQAAEDLKSEATALLATYPPDADFDDVPDADDNAPGDANPDQADCNTNGTGDVLELGANDCNSNGVPDECDPDCNTNGVVDECDINDLNSDDCNTNCVPDECDIASGASQDCNTNGTPDECELPAGGAAGGGGTDCNTNGTLDECEPDSNGNGIPEECECPCPGDMNSDGVVDGDDIPAFVTALITTPYNACADVSGDGEVVDILDVSIFVSFLQEGGPCP